MIRENILGQVVSERPWELSEFYKRPHKLYESPIDLFGRPWELYERPWEPSERPAQRQP